jgi:hypothetical protein
VVGSDAAVEATTVLQAARSAFSSNPLEGRRRRPQFVTLAFVDIDQSSTSNRPYLPLRLPGKSIQTTTRLLVVLIGESQTSPPVSLLSQLPLDLFLPATVSPLPSSRASTSSGIGAASVRAIHPPPSFLSVDRTVRCSQRPQHTQAQRALHTVILRIPLSPSRTTFPDGTELFARHTRAHQHTRSPHACLNTSSTANF